MCVPSVSAKGSECYGDITPTMVSDGCKEHLDDRSVGMTKKQAVAITSTLIAVGYAGAGVFYSDLVGLNFDLPNLCPVCPEIFSLGSPLAKFIGQTILFGTLNAILLAAGGWAVIGVVAGLRCLWPSSS